MLFLDLRTIDIFVIIDIGYFYKFEKMEDDDFPFPKQYDWKNKEFLGRGGFGEVYKVTDKKNKKPYAIKKIDMSKFDEPFKMEALKNQLNALQQIKSPYTIQMETYKIGKYYTYVVLQLCDDDLKQLLIKNGQKLPEEWAIQIIRQVVQGFKILVSKGYVHRDLKPENILSKQNKYKLADYGFIRKVGNIDFEKLKEICGTPFYMAPQLLYKKQYTAKCDIWGLGLVLYQSIFGYFPWPNRQINVYKQSVVCKPVAFPYKCQLGEYTKDFIERCLQLEQSDRMTWQQVFEHPLITKGKKGNLIKFVQVPPQLVRILIRVQESTSRKCVNAFEMFKKYEKYSKIDHKLFENLMAELDPQITTYQSTEIFRVMDSSKDGFINLEEFKKMFIEVDYRPAHDIASRRIQEIVRMAQSRNINIRDFFNLFDKDKSSKIDVQEFYSFIKYIAPQIPDQQIQLMWKRFDYDNSGYITMEEFVDEVTRGVPEMQSNLDVQNYEKAKRNLACLRSFLQGHKITAEQFFGKAKLNSHQKMRMQNFGPLIQKINYVITKEQIRDMFRLIDKNNSGTIEIQEIQQILMK